MFKVNFAQHRGGFTIDNEDGTKEYAFLDDREVAHQLVNSANRCETLVAALKKAQEALYNVPEVGKKYDQQHSDTHIRATLIIQEALAQGKQANKPQGTPLGM